MSLTVRLRMKRLLINLVFVALLCGCSRQAGLPGMSDHGSGDVVRIVMTCAGRQGAFKPPGIKFPEIKARWQRMSLPGQDMITLSGDHMPELLNLLSLSYGTPDPNLGSFGIAPSTVLFGPNKGQQVGNQRMFMYSAEQCGVQVSVMGDDKETQVMISRARKR
jgi:hypothetical protein